jgi:hypothetical protein
MEQEYAAAGVEPPLEELVDDQIAQLVMRRDGIGPADVWRTVEAARARLARSADSAAGRGGDALADRSAALAADHQVGRPAGSASSRPGEGF